MARVTQAGSLLLPTPISVVSYAIVERALGFALYWRRGNWTKTLPRPSI